MLLFKSQKEFAKNVTAEFKEVVGPASSKYELYQSVCKKLKAKIITGLQVPKFPLCDKTDETYHINETAKIIFGESFFDFLCNLKENEYKGYLKYFNFIRSMSMAECNDIINNKFITHDLPDVCRLA